MRKIKHLKFAALFILISSLFVCCKNEMPAITSDNNEIINGRPPQPPPSGVVHGVCGFDLDESTLIAAGWAKTFEDNFTTNLDKWTVWEGGAYNNELQLYQAANLLVTNGNLEITAKKETVTGTTTNYNLTPKSFDYTSGRIECKTNVSASTAFPKVRIASRIKLPAGYGMWPAFWSYGDPWPTQGEIDILEARGQEDNKYQTNYFYGKVANRNLVRNEQGYVTTDVSLQSCYHVYELVWSQNSLQFYFDGQLVKTNTGGYVSSLFGKTERIVFNLAVGGDFFSNFNPSLIQTGTMYVDWVKVFTSN